MASAVTLAARLVSAHGRPLERPVGSVTHLFPAAGVLAGLDPAALAMPAARAAALRGLARALADGDVVLDAALARLGQRRRPADAARLAEAWRPYRAYAVQHLWASPSATPDRLAA